MNNSRENQMLKMCRICFKKGEFTISCHKVVIDGIEYDLVEILKELSALETWDTEQYPSMLCNCCVKELALAFQFIQKLRRADEKIQEIFVDKSDSQTGDEIDITEDTIYENDGYIEHIVYDENGSDSETEADLDTVECISKKPAVKRSASRTPRIVLTNPVSSMLSNINQASNEIQANDTYEPKPKKISKNFEDDNFFLITKFVPQLQTETFADDPIEIGDGNSKQVRMFGMEAVEVKADNKVKVEEDEDSNIVDPNTMYVCQYCPRAFATSHHLIMHQRKSHVCQFCMKGFEKVTDLHQHTRTEHTFFNCAFCKKNFSSNSNLRQHIKKIHNVELPAHVALLSYKRKVL